MPIVTMHTTGVPNAAPPARRAYSRLRATDDTFWSRSAVRKGGTLAQHLQVPCIRRSNTLNNTGPPPCHCALFTVRGCVTSTTNATSRSADARDPLDRNDLSQHNDVEMAHFRLRNRYRPMNCLSSRTTCKTHSLAVPFLGVARVSCPRALSDRALMRYSVALPG